MTLIVTTRPIGYNARVMRASFFLLSAMLSASPTLAVEMDGGFTNTEPTVAGWDSGWNPQQPAQDTPYTGWDYIGNVDQASGIYLGDDWVLSAAHVAGTNGGIAGAADFTLATGPAAGTYVNTGVSYTFGGTNGHAADLVLFQIADPTHALAALPSLSLMSGAPADYLNDGTGNTVVMIGYGNQIRNPTAGTPPRGTAKAWGVDTVTLSSQDTPVLSGSTTYDSIDLYTADGPFQTQTNNSELVPGDSGGGDFILNPSTGLWELAGVNEAYGSTSVYYNSADHEWEQTGNPDMAGAQELDFSAMVQIGTYATQIEADMATPEPPASLLAAGGVGALALLARRRDWLSL